LLARTIDVRGTEKPRVHRGSIIGSGSATRVVLLAARFLTKVGLYVQTAGRSSGSFRSDRGKLSQRLYREDRNSWGL